MITSHIAVSVDFLFVFINHASVKIVIEAILLQDADEFLKLKLHSVGVLPGNDVKVELQVAREDVVGNQDSMTFFFTYLNGLHHCTI